jgi:hypothetical protein
MEELFEKTTVKAAAEIRTTKIQGEDFVTEV